MATETTQVSKKEVSQEELDELLGAPGPGADNVMIPTEQKSTKEKPSVFSRNSVDLNYLNESKNDTNSENSSEEENTVNNKVEDAVQTVNEIIEEADSTEGGTRRKNKNIGDALKVLIKAGKIIPFEDEKPLDEYTAKDLEELLDANFQEKETRIREQIPAQFFDSLPDELKVAAKYVADGGQDMKGLFRILAQAEEVVSMDPADPNNYEQIVRQFLTTTGFGTPEEIDEEIDSLRDRDELEKKAAQFKPKLDKMQEAIIGQKLAEQEQRQAAQAAAAKHYVGSIYKTLERGELNGIKLDRKTQELLYAGLVQPRYPSVSGKPTNLLGHLLEKYQYGKEQRHDIIAEALWLLADPEGYKSKIMEKSKNGTIEKTVRQLRTEEANRTPGSTIIEKEETTQRRVPRSNPNFFKR